MSLPPIILQVVLAASFVLSAALSFSTVSTILVEARQRYSAGQREELKASRTNAPSVLAQVSCRRFQNGPDKPQQQYPKFALVMAVRDRELYGRNTTL